MHLLLSAARICSSVDDFHMEQVRIDLSLILNEYPPSFIFKHFHRFFEIIIATSVLNSLSAKFYLELHQK